MEGDLLIQCQWCCKNRVSLYTIQQYGIRYRKNKLMTVSPSRWCNSKGTALQFENPLMLDYYWIVDAISISSWYVFGIWRKSTNVVDLIRT